MSIDSIRDTVARLKKRFGEARAEEICDELKIKILYIPMGQTPESCKGFFLRQSRKKVIVLNADLPRSYRRIILPHELGHGVLHGNLAKECHFHDFELFDETSRFEYEANIFAAEFLLPDEEVLTMLNEDMSFFQAAAALRVPPELLDFKFRVLKRMGYAINPPLYSQSNFMKNIDHPGRF